MNNLKLIYDYFNKSENYLIQGKIHVELIIIRYILIFISILFIISLVGCGTNVKCPDYVSPWDHESCYRERVRNGAEH